MEPTQSVIWRRHDIDELQNRSKHTATLVDDSTVLVAFGELEAADERVVFLQDLVLIDIKKDEMVYRGIMDPKNKHSGRSGHAAVNVNGNVIIMGGWAGKKKMHNNYVVVKLQETIDTQKFDEPACGAHGHTATLLENSNTVVLFGGKRIDPQGNKYLSSDMWEMDSTTFRWQKIGYRGVTMGRAFHSAVSPDPNTLIIQGGEVSDSKYEGDPTFYKYDRRSQYMMPIINAQMYNEGNALQWLDDVQPRKSHTMNGYVNNAGNYGVLIYGGAKQSIALYPTWAEFDATYDRVTQHYALPSKSGEAISARSGHTATLIDNKLCVIGGKLSKDNSRSKGIYTLEGTPVNPPTKEAAAGHVPKNVPKVQFSKIVVESDRDNYKKKTVADEFKNMDIAFKPGLSTMSREQQQSTPYHIIQFLELHFAKGVKRGGMDEHPLKNVLAQPSQVFNLIDKVEAIFKQEESCINLPLPLKIFGDIHGQLADLFAFFKKYGSPIETQAESDIHLLNYAFLGDFVDRGQNSFEVICLLYALKTLYPEKIFLVRGNHEEAEVNEIYGFLRECQQKYGDGPGRLIWERFNQSFNWMPLGALINNKVLCVHGGVGERFTKLDLLRNIKRPLKLDDDELLRDILWADPSQKPGVVAAPGRGERVNEFGPDVSAKFCADNGISLIIRAHQCVENGYEKVHPKVLTVFSATNYCGSRDNKGAVIIIDTNMVIHTRTIAPSGNDVWTDVRNASPPSTPRRD